MERLNGIEGTKKIIGKLEDTSIKITQPDNKENMLKKIINMASVTYWKYNKRSNIHVIRLLVGEEKEGGVEQYLNK